MWSKVCALAHKLGRVQILRLRMGWALVAMAYTAALAPFYVALTDALVGLCAGIILAYLLQWGVPRIVDLVPYRARRAMKPHSHRRRRDSSRWRRNWRVALIGITVSVGVLIGASFALVAVVLITVGQGLIVSFL